MAKKQVWKMAGNQNARKAEPRCKKVTVRFSVAEHTEMVAEAEVDGVTLGEFIRGMVLPY